MAKVPLRGLKGRLVNSSIDAYILALESVNRLSVRYRIESFTFLIVNAWELMLKARLIHLSGKNDAILFPKEKGKPRRSLDIGKCIRVVYQNPNNPKRLNLEFVVEERDKAVHLVLDRLPRNLLAVYQACVINYHHELEDWFGISLGDRVPVGMMTLVYDLSPETFDLSNRLLRRHLGAETVLYLMERQGEIEELQQLVGQDRQFAAEIKVSVEVASSPGKAQVLLRKGIGGMEIGVVDKPRDPALTHPHRANDAVREINDHLAGRHRITTHDLVSIAHCHNTKRNSNHYFKSHVPGSPSLYSNGFIEWVVDQFERDAKFFQKCRDVYRPWLRTNKKRRSYVVTKTT